jgi:hypothetical protein
VLCPRCCGCGPAELVCSHVHCLLASIKHVEAIYVNKIIVKLSASSWNFYIVQYFKQSYLHGFPEIGLTEAEYRQITKWLMINRMS